MSTLVLTHIAATTDVFQSYSDGTFGPTDFPFVGFLSGVTYGVGIRFASVAVPQGVRILHAAITANWIDAATIELQVAAIDVDNGGTYADQAAWLAADRTAFSDAFTLTSIGSSRIPGCNCTDAVQTVVNRAGWASGNTLELDWKGTGDVSARARISANSTSHGSSPQLSIAYTTEALGGRRPRLVTVS